MSILISTFISWGRCGTLDTYCDIPAVGGLAGRSAQ